MPFCGNCGNRIEETNRFCPNCGKEIKKAPIASGYEAFLTIDDNQANLKDLKSLLNLTYETMDAAESIIPSSIMRDLNGTRLRAILEMDMNKFSMFLASSDGRLSPQERDFLNYIFDKNVSEQNYCKMIKDLNIYSYEYEHDIPFSIILSTCIDNDLNDKAPGSPKMTPLIMRLYQEMGKALILSDNDKSSKEIQDYTNYMKNLIKYINDNTSSSNNQTSQNLTNPITNSQNNSNNETIQSSVSTIDGTKVYQPSIYKVGIDIPAGKYKLFALTSDETAYYALCNDPNGDDIVANDNFYNQAYIYISNGQYIELSDCCAVPINSAKLFSGTTYADGEYLVGQEIKPGEYRVQATPGIDGYYSLESFDIDGSRNIDSNRLFDNVAYVAPSAGQILVLKDCTIRL